MLGKIRLFDKTPLESTHKFSLYFCLGNFKINGKESLRKLFTRDFLVYFFIYRNQLGCIV